MEDKSMFQSNITQRIGSYYINLNNRNNKIQGDNIEKQPPQSQQSASQSRSVVYTLTSDYLKALEEFVSEGNVSENKTYKDLEQALNDYVNDFRSNVPNFESVQKRVEYYLEYNNTCIDYYKQMMNASDATDEDKEYCKRMINLHNRDKNNQLIDLNNYAKENGIKTESFEDVYNEFVANVPDRTTTESEKELAISYINRMLSCNDIPENLKIYWTFKKNTIQTELLGLKQSDNSDAST